MKKNRKLFSLLLTLALLCMQLVPAVTAMAAETHTVSFDINIMEPGILTPPPQTVEDGDTAEEPSSAPEAFGCTFLGWFLGSSKYDFDTPVTSDITLKAEWDIGPEYYSHQVWVFHGTPNIYGGRIGTLITITADEPETGKVFDKWVVDHGGITLADEYSSTTTFEMQLENVKVTATYKDAPVTYAITCDGVKVYSDSAKTIEITEAAAGATVYVKYETPADDSKFVGAVTFDGAYMGFTDYWNGIAMPDHAVSVSAVLVDRETYTIDLSSSSGTATGVPWDVVFSNVPLFELSFYPTLPKEVDVDSDGTNDIYVTEETAGSTVTVEKLGGSNIITSYDEIFSANRHYSTVTYLFNTDPVTEYNVWVGSTQVTSGNKDDILGDGGKAKYDPETNTLTLNGLTLNGAYSEAAILVKGINLKIEGSGNITNTNGSGIASPESSSSGGITLNGDFTVTGSSSAIASYPGVTVSGGTLKATTTNVSGRALSSYSPISISDNLEIIKPEGGKISSDQRTIEDDACNPATYVEIGPKSETYPVWVGLTQVTSVNKDDILGDGKAAFDPATNTLTLNDPAITTLFNDGYNSAVICADGIDLIITGSATLENSSAQFGILCYSGNLTITGEITAKAEYSGISAIDDIIISGDSTVVTAEGGRYGIDTYHNISIQGGTVEATGTDASESFGIFTESDAIEIKGSSTKVTATGKTSAVTAYSSTITIESPLSVVTPEGGSVSSDGKNIVGSDGTTVATHALIMPKEAPLPKVIGVKANVTGTEVSGGQCSVKAEGLEAVFESTAAPVTMNVGYLYTEQACSNILTTAPVPGTDYYFILRVFGFTDGDPATLTWAANDVIKSGSAVTADNADVEIVELAHSPAGGSLSVIVKYTEKAVTPTVTHTVTFNANGHGTAPAAQTVEDGNAVARPEDPSETGWTFDGWYQEAACTTAFDFSTAITADITLYAKWTEESVTPGVITYTVTGGGNSTWTKGSSSTITITVKRSEADDTCFSHFSGVQIDGTTLAPGDYDAKSGSTVITLKAATLQKLSTGSHTVTVNFDDGKAETKLMVKAASSPTDPTTPQTGDNSHMALWLALLCASGAGIAALVIGSRKRKART